METRRLLKIRTMSEAACLAEPPRAGAALISITEPGRRAPLPSGWAPLLRVQFTDAEFDASSLERLAARGVLPDLEAKGMPCRARCAPILAFLDTLADDPSIRELIVHCHAGRRRSVAVAKFAAERFSAPYEASADYNRTVYALLRDPRCFDQFQNDGSHGLHMKNKVRTAANAFVWGALFAIGGTAGIPWAFRHDWLLVTGMAIATGSIAAAANVWLTRTRRVAK